MPVLVMTLANSRFMAARMIPSRHTEDLLLDMWDLLQQFERVPRRLIWDNEAGIGRGKKRAVGVEQFMGSLGTKLVLLPPRDPESKCIVSGTYQVDVLQVDEELIWFTVTNPDTGEKSEYRSDQADYSVIPLALILVPSLGAIFKALFLSSAVVVIAGVTYIAADKAIAGIREAIRKKKNPPAHYKVVRRTNGLLIGDGMSKNEAVSRARASGDVWSTTKAGARSVAYSVRSKTPVGPEKDKTNSSKKYCHYHPSGRSPGSHAFYGVAGQAC